MVLGTVGGAPLPLDGLVPLDVDAGLPGPRVRWSKTSSVPVSAVVTKPPMLGLAMPHSEKGTEMSASTSISPSSRSAETEKPTDLVTPCMVNSPAVS